jgi:hypothetical protein
MSLHFKKRRLTRKCEVDVFNFFSYKPLFFKTHVGQFLLKLTLERKKIQFTNPNVFRPDLKIPKKVSKPHSFFLWRLMYRNRLKCHFRLRAQALKALLTYPFIGRTSGEKHFITYFDGRLDHNMIRHFFAFSMEEARIYIESEFILVNDITCPSHHLYSMKTGDSFCSVSTYANIFVGPIFTKLLELDLAWRSMPTRTEHSLPLRRFKFWASHALGTSESMHFNLRLKFMYNISRTFS